MTQITVDDLLALVLSQAREAGIPVSDQIDPHVVINTRARTRFGCCRTENGRHTIELSASMLGASQTSVCQVLAHEVLHTCPGCHNHGQRWKRWAERMNGAYGYRISRTDSHRELGAEDLRVCRYLVVCDRCGQQTPRMKRSPLVEHPERYRCRCGGTLRVTETQHI